MSIVNMVVESIFIIQIQDLWQGIVIFLYFSFLVFMPGVQGEVILVVTVMRMMSFLIAVVSRGIKYPNGDSRLYNPQALLLLC